MKRTLLAAALVAAATAAPATAKPAEPDWPTWNVTTTGQTTALGYVDATCYFTPQRWVHDYGNTLVHAVAVTSGALSTTVRCELLWDGEHRGDQTWTQDGPVLYAEDGFSYVSDTGVQICVTASATFATTNVSAPRTCKYV
ncbi:MAG TPA: hypothetical protein VNQ77_02885 [Frankiaceae bacterium]|nr:hypothetical protein [Frankiaceae bacterium]